MKDCSINLEGRKNLIHDCDINFESNLEEKISKYFIAFLTFAGISSFCALSIFYGVNVTQFISFASVFGVLSVSSLVAFLSFDFKLKNLRKNKKFLDVEQNLNSNIKGNANILKNSSEKTRNVISNLSNEMYFSTTNSFNHDECLFLDDKELDIEDHSKVFIRKRTR